MLSNYSHPTLINYDIKHHMQTLLIFTTSGQYLKWGHSRLLQGGARKFFIFVHIRTFISTSAFN
ncbi:hypothetical protein [Candidatus Blochmanniella camponoti]|uniref:Uncharacterized protein n=1 Tax=Candidatus Blochmanniella camponoti TaxID=108080 RepID=A0ABY4SUP4_9ENTR|nr:hypothetical protein [Candidatus Blochmannia herculeanus]URJ24511.1 hypothetical protein M9404_03295 [Candidatus Blochmannia herculeanus]